MKSEGKVMNNITLSNKQNISIWDFELTDEDMEKIDSLDLGYSEIIDHNNPEVVKYILSGKIED